MQAYSDPTRANDPHTLPDVEIFQLTAEEVARSEAYEDEQHEFMRRYEYRTASMSSRAQAAMIDAMIEELGITGGWFYWYCFPGCMPESSPFGPYPSVDAALAAARNMAEAA